MSKLNPARLRAVILEVVDNQLRDNTPPETQQTLTRLVGEGYSIEEAKRLIGVVVVHEIFNVLQREEFYNQERYVAALKRLPKLPDEDKIYYDN